MFLSHILAIYAMLKMMAPTGLPSIYKGRACPV